MSLTGATTGSLICYVWPSIMFITMSSKIAENKYKNIIVNVFLVIGIFIFCICSITAVVKFQPTKQTDDVSLVGQDGDLYLMLAF